MLNGNLSCVPVVNLAREVVRLVFWKELFQGEVPVRPKQRLNVPVVIMAGGQGTRLAPFTNVLPKPLIPVGDKTVIEIIIDQLLAPAVPINSFFRSTTNRKFSSRSLRSSLPAYSVTFPEEKERRGTAGSLRALYSAAQDDLIVSNCDVVIQTDIPDLVAFHQGQQVRSDAGCIAQGVSDSIRGLRT